MNRTKPTETPPTSGSKKPIPAAAERALAMVGLPNPERAFRGLIDHVRPGGWVHVYLYWQPPHAWHRALLRAVSAARRATVRLPRPLLHFLCYPVAAAL